MNSESTLSDALSEVDTALAASDNERAAGIASELLLAYPNAVLVLRQRARALTAAGRALQAAEVHRRVLEILPADGEAMAGLARALYTAGQNAEARDAARQALDYHPSDETLRRIAENEGLPFQVEQASLHLYKARVHAQAGLLHRGSAGLRNVIAQWPERTDVKIALMQILWRKGARIAAAEQAQAVLDEFPYCLNAHLLLLEMWRDAGAGDMERVHLQAIDQVDPDHRATRAMLGTQSPLPVQDVPARPAQHSEPAAADEDPLAREAWVDSLMAESSASPKPLEQHRNADDDLAQVLVDEATSDAEAERDEPSEFVSSFLPLDWSAANDLSEEPAQDDFGVSWIDGNVKDEFAPARPRTAQPDPNDGVPAELPALEWERAGDESAAQKDPRTAVDGGIVPQTDMPVAAGNEEPRISPLRPLVAAGAIAAAQRKDERPDTEQPTSSDTTHASIPPVAAQATLAETAPGQAPAIAPTAQAESVSSAHGIETEAAQALRAEKEAAAIKSMPLEADAVTEEDATRADAVKTASDEASHAHLAPPIEALAPAQETSVSPAETAPTSEAETSVAEDTIAAQPTSAVIAASAPARTAEQAQPASERDSSILKAVAVAGAMSAAARRRKKKASAEETARVPAIEDVPSATQPIAPAASLIEPAPPEITQAEAVPALNAPAETPRKSKQETAGKTAKSRQAKKPAAKPATLESQTEKVRKTYERAITTAKREDLPRLIKELNQAAERDPDNKIIFELLGQAYNRSGDIPAAIGAYRKALELAGQA